MIAEILRELGFRVHLVGNIGVPALAVLPKIRAEDVVVYELSSFQLWDLERSPQVAVLTIFEPDHLDVHTSYREYLAAKSNIFQHQTRADFLVYNGKDEQVTAAARSGVAFQVVYPQESALTLARATNLPGRHNLLNAQAAVLAAQSYLTRQARLAFDRGDIPSRPPEFVEFSEQQAAQVQQALERFTGLDHRLKLVGEVDGVRYYDDSIATTPGSALAAIKSFAAPKVLILGGKDKGGDYTSLARELASNSVREVLAFGENRARIAQELRSVSSVPVRVLETSSMAEVVQLAALSAEDGDVVILSPAAASFDLFKNYQDRGAQFIEAVERLAGKPALQIGVFDSGLGGEFVAQALQELRPGDDFQVVNDAANVPYGDKTPEEIYALTKRAITPLLVADVLVIACNTATAYAIDRLRVDYPEVRFVGFEPMIKPASLNSSTGSIAVLATPATLRSERYLRLKQEWASGYDVFEPDCSTWARKIEDATFSEEDVAELKRLVQEEGIDQVILACTHYLGVQSILRRALPQSTAILQPIKAINRQISRLVVRTA